jgi:ribosomal protein S18 acetylase RimI-like enzyme
VEEIMTIAKVQPGPLSEAEAARFAPQIPLLIRATGPASYDYQFGTDGLLEKLVAASWVRPDTLFCAACTTAMIEDGELLGIEFGFAGPNFYTFKSNLAALAPALIQRGEASYEELSRLMVRAGKASYLNAHIPDDVYYLHALAAFPQYRGKGIGKVLFQSALQRARTAGFRELQLDVLADNPAVGFYQAMGLSILAEIRSPELSRDHGFPSEYRMAVTL